MGHAFALMSLGERFRLIVAFAGVTVVLKVTGFIAEERPANWAVIVKFFAVLNSFMCGRTKAVNGESPESLATITINRTL